MGHDPAESSDIPPNPLDNQVVYAKGFLLSNNGVKLR
jgi:hypothetical protein